MLGGGQAPLDQRAADPERSRFDDLVIISLRSMVKVGPRVRIRLPPGQSPLRTSFAGKSQTGSDVGKSSSFVLVGHVSQKTGRQLLPTPEPHTK